MKKINWLILLCWLSLWNTSLAQMLNSLPNNSDTIIETEPTLVWQCMTSYIGNPRYSMVLTVTEMAEEQSPVEALLENTPILYRENLSQNSFTITSTEAILNENVWYAWQATLLYDGVPVQQSEAWKFIISQPLPPVVPSIKLRQAVDNSIYTLRSDNIELIVEDLTPTQFTAYLFDENNVKYSINLIEHESNSMNELKVFKLNLSDLDLEDGVYRFEWQPTKKQHYRLYLKNE